MRVLAAVAIVLAIARGAHAGDPTLQWRTVETAHFVIYYWEPLDDVAHRLAVVAEHAHDLIAPALDHEPTEKTLIYLIDNTDSANGFASVIPRNAIQVNATGPSSFTELDDHEDWLYGLIAHEYTHIIHLDTFDGLPTIYNKIFGKQWAPNQIMPRWLIEGIAVYEESKRSAGGRNRGTRFDSYIRIARHAKRQFGSGSYELRLDEVTGNPRQYPQGNAAYVYGSHFLRYIFDRFGDDTLRKMSHTSGSWAIPFAVNRQIAKTVGKPFTELYGDWNKYLRDHYGLEEMAAERRGLRTGHALTATAQTNMWPRWLPGGNEYYWVQSDGYRHAYVRAAVPGAIVTPEAAPGVVDKAARDVVQIDGIGPFDLLRDGSFVFEQGRVYRTFYAFEDIFRYDAKTQQTIRLTTGERARDPAVSPDGRRIAFSMNEHTHSVLAVMPNEPGAAPSVAYEGGRWDEAYTPAWSPDGARIAFSAWRYGGYRDILVLDLASGKVDEITHDRAIDMAPAWSADGKTLFFDSDRTGISNIYAFDFADRSTWQVTNVLGGAFDARPSPDGARLLYEAQVAKGGYDIYELPIGPGPEGRATWQPAHPFLDDKPPPERIADDAAVVSAPRRYRALETLGPQTWTGQIDASSHQASLQTSGTDAVGLHAWSLAVSEDLQRLDTNVGASYTYTGFRPSLSVAGSRTLVTRGGWQIDGVGQPFLEEDWAGTVSLGIPLESRPSASWSLGFAYNIDWYRLAQPPAGGELVPPDEDIPYHPLTDYREAGLSTRMSFSRVRSTLYGLGPQDGFDASVAVRVDTPALGSTYRNITASYSFDLYQKLWGRSPVLALRLVGAVSQGDLIGNNAYSLGGVPAQDVVTSIVNSVRTSPVGYLHGYTARAVMGSEYHLLNLEYRQELWIIEHGLGTLPIYLERLHMAVMSDVGTAFNGLLDATKNVRWSLGGALRLDAFFGYFIGGTFEIGYARGLIQSGATNETWFLLTTSL